jgi:hypothetical protein
VFTTHLSPGSQSFLKALQIDNEKYGVRFVNTVQRRQLAQLVTFMQRCITTNINGKTTVAPEYAPSNNKQAAACIAPPIILAGDFNFDGASMYHHSIRVLPYSTGLMIDIFHHIIAANYCQLVALLSSAGVSLKDVFCESVDGRSSVTKLFPLCFPL